ncbi:MAG: heavy metal translocating P-type ATPase [Proteobacteria bacterium]|nr:heavy metal translocating P-type ATPase [Pseudomonadota bacterium]
MTQPPPRPHSPKSCFHCGESVPQGFDFKVDIDGNAESMCCPGCQAVARTIVDSGLGDYYRFRTGPSETGKETVPEFLRQARVYDNEKIQKSFVIEEEGDIREVSLVLEGISCAACIWLSEQHLAQLPGVKSAHINYTTRRARVRWDNSQIQLSQILEAISHIGYRAHPYDPKRQQALLEKERRHYLIRLGTAGVLGMQVMALAISLYGGDWFGIEPEFRTFLQWVSLLLTAPVISYCAAPFFRGAWRDLRLGQVGMDVPVTLGISIAFIASVWSTTSGRGHVYYDSVVMFVLLLLASRYFELAARKQAAEATDALVQLTPAMATRINENGDEEEIAAVELVPDDHIRVRPGETIATDGIVIEGRSSVDESLLTGESLPVSKQIDDELIGGTINRESPLLVRVSRIGEDSVLAGMLRLLERAQTEKPALARLADRIASRFVAIILLLACLIAWYWWQQGADDWLSITIAVLVVTCPCALSLATPTAITAATGQLTRMGLLTTRGHSLETLSKLTHFVFDKTGTLTEGRLTLHKIVPLADMSETDCLNIAIALEQGSEHPIAVALRHSNHSGNNVQAQHVSNTPGAGVNGLINDKPVYLGTPAFAMKHAGSNAAPSSLAELEHEGYTVIMLADEQQPLAVFALGDRLRADAAKVVSQLKAMGIQPILMTGDREAAAKHMAAAAGIEALHWGMRPEDKLAAVKQLQDQGAIVAMLGDGINDAPVLAAAQVSIAMGGGTQLAQASADMILLSQQLGHLLGGLDLSRRTMRIIRQNFSWAIAYNLVALPLAASGMLSPWMAAIGMSLSSLLVTVNAMRLGQHRHQS